MDQPLNNHGLLDVISAITSRQESGRLQITASGSRGAFFFQDGRLVVARMGPFSGFPAVNFAVSMGEVTTKFDSLIQPPAATLFALDERTLLKERFGIETLDLKTEAQAPATEHPSLQIATATQVALPEPPSHAQAGAAQNHRYEPGMSGSRNGASARGSRIRARSRRTRRKQSEPRFRASQFPTQTEADRTRLEKEKTINVALPVREEEKRSQTPELPTAPGSSNLELGEVAETRRCPKCDRVYSDARDYCLYDATQLVNDNIAFPNATAKPGVTMQAWFWTLIIFTFLVSSVGGYWLNNYISKEPGRATPVRAESDQPQKAEQDQPVVEGALHDKEATLVKPEYPARAKSKGVSGNVTVAILVNKQGLVVSARVLNGPPMLRGAALVAARQSKFAPEKLADQGAKISGTITYNFKF
jgi:TonB family protein